jgi:hypothetical protein
MAASWWRALQHFWRPQRDSRRVGSLISRELPRSRRTSPALFVWTLKPTAGRWRCTRKGIESELACRLGDSSVSLAAVPLWERARPRLRSEGLLILDGGDLVMIRAVAIFIALSALNPEQAATECILQTFAVYKRQADFIFEGTVTKLVPIDGHEVAAEMHTHRVWKGKIARTHAVHFVSDIDGPIFKPGERYIIFGVRETDRRRRVFSLVGEAHEGIVWVNPCAGTSFSSPEMVEQLGRSKKPSEAELTSGAS